MIKLKGANHFEFFFGIMATHRFLKLRGKIFESSFETSKSFNGYKFAPVN